MAAASPYIKEPAVSGFGLGLGLLALVGLAAASGVLLALGEMQALWICLSIVAGFGVLYDFRVGAALLIILLPFSASSVFPHELMGIRGLNPINVLVLGTLGSYLLHGRIGHAGRLVPRPLLWLYLLPILAAGAIGAPHAEDILPYFYDEGVFDFNAAPGYLRDMVIKPLLIVVMAVMVGAAVAKSDKPDRFIVPLVISVWVMCLLEILFVVASGARLGELASANAREFFTAIGLHANNLGRLYTMAWALVLFAWWEARQPTLKAVLFITLGMIGIALVLTFSRGAFLGFAVVNLLFLMWKFNAKTLGLAVAGTLFAVALAPGYLVRRLLVGFDTGTADAVSAGRVETIWEPLLPEMWKNPFFGDGIGSMLWSYPMLTEGMQIVTHPHNAYLEAVLDMGFIGLAVLLVFFYTVWRGFRSLGSHAYLSPLMRGFFQGAAAGLVAFFVTAWAGSSFRPVYEWTYLWVAIGMMYGMQARNLQKRDPQARATAS